jgi:uncharacterized membrane protein
MNSRHGFLLSNGQFTTFDFPGAFSTQPVGINDYGDIVGRYCTVSPCGQPGSSNSHGFLLHEGEFTSIDFPEALQSTAWKINASGQIVGAYQSADGGYHVFQISMCGLLSDPSNPPFATIDFPEGINPWLVNGGINAWGDVVTGYCDTAPCEASSTDNHGLLLSRGELSTIDFPGAAETAAFGINAAGDVVGVIDGPSGHGFVISIKQEETRRGGGRRASLRTLKPAFPAAAQE